SGRFLGLGSTHLTIDHEQHYIGTVHRLLSLRRHRGLQTTRTSVPTAGVDHRDQPTTPHGLVTDTIPGDTGHILDNGRTSSQQSIHQCGLADVRSPHHSQHGTCRCAVGIVVDIVVDTHAGLVVGLRIERNVDNGELRLVMPATIGRGIHRGLIVTALVLGHCRCFPASLSPWRRCTRWSSTVRTSSASSCRNFSVPAASPLRPGPTRIAIGSPTTMSTRGRNRRRTPPARSVPRVANGTITAPCARASHAAPPSARATVPSPRIPSGNTQTMPPECSTSPALVRAARCAPPRCTAICPSLRSPHPRRPVFNSSFIRKAARRG